MGNTWIKLEENQIGKVWKVYYFENSWKRFINNSFKHFFQNRKKTNRTIIFYQHFVFFFIDRNQNCLFPYFWKFTFFKRMFENNFNGKISAWLQIFIILIDILSQPWALLGSNVFIIANISFSVTWKDFILLPVLHEKGGKYLALSVGVHIEAKQLLKMFAYLQKSETNLPSTRRGGIVGSFLLWFNIVQCVFGEVLESASFLVILRM